MGYFLPAFDYPSASPDIGYWAPVTSTINWCEEDYYATRYLAEIVNTVTNLLFIVFGIKGLQNCIEYNHDRVFKIAFTGYLLVGIGSFAFHATLKYSMQLVDELSMIYTVCLMCYATFSFARSRIFQRILGFSLLFLSVSISLCYYYLQNPMFHQTAFAILIIIVLLRSMYLMEFKIRKSLQKRHESILKQTSNTTANFDQLQKIKMDLDTLNRMWILVGFGLSIFLGGFIFWNLDNKYCSTLRHWRHKIGLPWGLFLEGHGWWHLMTGFGTYIYITWGVWLRCYICDRQKEFGLSWPSLFFSLPKVVLLPSDDKIDINQSEKLKAN